LSGVESAMNLSVTEPIGAAFRHTRRILFQPFQVGKWFLLGFCVFLAQCDQGGGGGGNIPNFGGRWSPGGGAGAPGPGAADELQAALNWISQNMTLIGMIGVLALIVVIAFQALVTWIASRGKFMVLDGLARNRGAVSEPWREQRHLGNSLFVFSFLLGLVALVVFLGIILLGVALCWPDIRAQRFGDRALLGLGVSLPLLAVAGIALLIVNALLQDFVVVAMYLRNERVMPAWCIVRDEVIRGRIGRIILFYLMRLVLSIGVGIVGMIAVCATCCIAAIPYLGSAVILLPLHVFMRCYTLCFVEQVGPEWRVLVVADDTPHCTRCGYDLRYNTTGICPECGTPTAPRVQPGPPPPAH
jgi:hypothetical protein